MGWGREEGGWYEKVEVMWDNLIGQVEVMWDRGGMGLGGIGRDGMRGTGVG